MRAEVLRVAVVKAISNALGRGKADADGALLAASDAEGIRRAVALLPDGTEVADVTVVVPKRAAVVSDPDAFTEYVVEYDDSHIIPEQEVKTIVPASVSKTFIDDYLPYLVERDGRAYDPDSGELVPGVKFAARVPYPSVKFRAGGEQQVLDAITRGVLNASDTLALGGGND